MVKHEYHFIRCCHLRRFKQKFIKSMLWIDFDHIDRIQDLLNGLVFIHITRLVISEPHLMLWLLWSVRTYYSRIMCPRFCNCVSSLLASNTPLHSLEPDTYCLLVMILRSIPTWDLWCMDRLAFPDPVWHRDVRNFNFHFSIMDFKILIALHRLFTHVQQSDPCDDCSKIEGNMNVAVFACTKKHRYQAIHIPF